MIENNFYNLNLLLLVGPLYFDCAGGPTIVNPALESCLHRVHSRTADTAAERIPILCFCILS
jgi:hypothetical protein